MSEMVDVVDERDATIRSAPREEVENNSLLHRTAGVVVFDSRGRILAHQRAGGRMLYPSKFDVKFSGYVQSGESYEAAARRELFEEAGIKAKNLVPLLRYRFEGGGNNVFSEIFGTRHDGKFKVDPGEVRWAGYMTMAEIGKIKGKLSPTGRRVYDELARRA